MASSTPPWVLRRPWRSDSRIVVGIDIGTHDSGAAFIHLSKGIQPFAHRVASWPGQEAINWQSKIPTMIWYDANIRPLSIGAEAILPGVQGEAEGQGWSRATNFKLQSPPESITAPSGQWLDAAMDLSPQASASLRQAYSDYLKYLLLHTESAFRDRVVDSSRIWALLAPTMELVITHPSGWGTREQALLRLAAVEAGYTNPDQISANIKFLTEAEAAIHFYIHHTSPSLRDQIQLQDGANFVVCDIGVSTVVTTVCTVESTRPVLKLKQNRPSTCIQAGSKLIDWGLEHHLRQTFTGAGLPNDTAEGYIKNAVQDFGRTTKYRFKDANVDYRINLGNARHSTDSALRIRRGTMTLSGALVKSFFDPCIQEIIGGVDRQIQGVHAPYILLLGELGDSPYLRQEFRKQYEPQGCRILLANDSTSKAYAFGAVLWSAMQASSDSNFSDHQSRRAENARILYDPCLSRSYGFEASIPYDHASPDHEDRFVTITSSGIKVVQGRWWEFVRKDTPLDQNVTIKKPISLNFSTPRLSPSVYELILYSYSGDEEPLWMRDERGSLCEGFQELFPFSVDLTKLAGALEPRMGAYGVINWHIDFDICLQYRAGGFQAEAQWQEKGVIQTAPITHNVPT